MQWEDTENKSAVITYVAGGAALVWLSGTVVGAINSIPVVSLNVVFCPPLSPCREGAVFPSHPLRPAARKVFTDKVSR